MNRFDWTWEIGGDGPHSYLNLVFENASAASMHARASQLLRDGFKWSRAHDDFQDWMTHNSGEWSFLEVGLSAVRIYITRGWGYSRQGEEDFQLLERLFSDGNLSLERWRVQAGGDGYAQIYIGSGSRTEEFIAYCRHEKEKESSLEEVEATLRRLLDAPEMRHLYHLGERCNSTPSLQWPVQFNVPMLYRGWEDHGYREELLLHSRNFERLAEELCDLCHVRTFKSGFAVETETQLMRGGSIHMKQIALP